MDWRMVFAVLIVLSSVVLISGCTGGSKEYTNSYMSFSYPDNWQITKDEIGQVSFSTKDQKLYYASRNKWG